MVVDVGAGLGGDTIAIAEVAEQVVAVDIDESRLVLLRHNASQFDVHPDLVCGDAASLPVVVPGLLHADPSRRLGGRRLRRLADYHPSMPALGPWLRQAAGGAIVVSPGVRLDDPDLPQGELEFVQVGRDLVEAVVWTGELSGGARRSATVLSGGAAHHIAHDGGERLAVADVGEWLLEPAVAAVRARLHDHLGAEVGAWRIARNRALLTADHDPGTSPWWRAGRVEAVLPLRAKALRAWLAEGRTGPIEFVLHGVDLDVDEFWRAVGSPRRDWGGRVAHLVRLDAGAACVVTSVPAGGA